MRLEIKSLSPSEDKNNEKLFTDYKIYLKNTIIKETIIFIEKR